MREFGQTASSTQTLPAGTLYIPMQQPSKHWIQAVLGENPYMPVDYYYDVVQWSYSLQRGQSGNGFLTALPTGVAMTEIDDPAWGSAPPTEPAVYAFDTDSMRGLALAAKLLDAGATVFRGEDAFDAAGKHFETGAALVDGPSVTAADIDIRALAVAHQTPVSALDDYPVDRYELDPPKIGLYFAGATEPNNPIRPAAGSPYPGHCGVGGNTVYCQALFTLTQKIGLPGSMVLPITTPDLEAGDLINEGFTALINPSSTLAAGPGATALQAFVNQGGRYVGQLAGGTTTARNAGLTLLNTNPIAQIETPGAFFSATFDTANPAAWGFDNGGFLYRESSNDPNYDPATLAGNGGAIPAAGAAVAYAIPLESFGFSRNALGAGQLPGRPAVVDQPFGAGRSILLGFDAFYRAWRESDERLILNAVLYPDDGVIAPTARRAAATTAAPVAAAKLPAVRKRKLASVSRTARDVRIKVARRDGAQLRRAVRAAKLPKRLQRKVRWQTTRKSVTLVVKRARTRSNEHDRGVWIGLIVKRLRARERRDPRRPAVS